MYTHEESYENLKYIASIIIHEHTKIVEIRNKLYHHNLANSIPENNNGQFETAYRVASQEFIQKIKKEFNTFNKMAIKLLIDKLHSTFTDYLEKNSDSDPNTSFEIIFQIKSSRPPHQDSTHLAKIKYEQEKKKLTLYFPAIHPYPETQWPTNPCVSGGYVIIIPLKSS